MFDSFEEKAYCYKHHQSEATNTCRMCLKPICSTCTIDIGFEEFCPSCVKKKRLVKILKSSVIVSVVLLLIFFISKHLTTSQKEFNYGAYKYDIQALKEHLVRVPGDRIKIIELGEKLVEAGAYEEAIKVCNEFKVKNGNYLRLNWITYGAHKYLSNFDSAIVEVTELIENDPYDSDYRWWRGQVYEMKEDYPKAIEDYRQTIALKPGIGNIPFNLSDLLEKIGKPCEAALPIEQFLYYNPAYRNKSDIRMRLHNLYNIQECNFNTLTGSGKIPFTQNSGAIIVTATINKDITGKFIFDTGATHVVISDSLASKLKINKDHTHPMLVQTAGGIRLSEITTLNQVSLQGATAQMVEVAILKQKDLGNAIDGLLGLSFISRFNISIDYEKGVIHLTKKGTTNG